MRNHNIIILRSLLLVPVIVALAACSPRVVPGDRPTSPGYQEAGVRLKSRAEYYRFYQAKLHVRAQGPKGKINLRAVVLADLTGRLRLEASNPFGQTVGLLLLDHEHSLLWLPTENVVYTARRPEVLVHFLLGVDVSLDTFAYALMASGPPSLLNDLQFHDQHGMLVARASLPSPESSYTWEFLASPLTLNSLHVVEGGTEYTVSYDPPADMGIAETPKKLRFASLQWNMEVNVDQLVRTSEPPADAFQRPFASETPEIALDKVK